MQVTILILYVVLLFTACEAGVALDAATRGLRVALVERDDFGAGTSGRSTKLIHGGIRYLQNAFLHLDYKEYELVKEALRERKHMLTCAPYMNKPLPIMIPLYRRHWYDVFKVPYYYVGARVYDFVAGRDSGVPASSFISKEEAIYQFPMIEDKHLMGAIVYYGMFWLVNSELCPVFAINAAHLVIFVCINILYIIWYRRTDE